MKKYYAAILYNGKMYVLRFKIKGSLTYDPRCHCFQDKDYYVRSVDDVVALAALDSNPHNDKYFRFGYLIPHEQFKFDRSQHIPRWHCKREIIDWP